MTREEVQLILHKYVNVWNSANHGCHLWVALANPGAAITIPDITFGMTKNPQQVAGMNIRVHVQLIVLREDMTPESLLVTFFHEYGHACYEREHPGAFNEVDSEAAAICGSLELCVAEGFEELAYREAKSVKGIAADEPYRSAIAKLADNELWRKYVTGGHTSGQSA
jgi:hypothetical protein